MIQASARPWYYATVTVIVTGCLVAVVNFGVRSSFGLFTAPMSEFHDWPREVFSMGLAIQNLLWGIATPAAGALADRFGAARVIMVGAVIYCIGTIGMAYSHAPLAFNVTAGLLIGTGIAMSSFGIVIAALGRIVPPEQRSWAFGIATASGLPRTVHLLAARRRFDHRLWVADRACHSCLLLPHHDPARAPAHGAEHLSLQARAGRERSDNASSHPRGLRAWLLPVARLGLLCLRFPDRLYCRAFAAVPR